MITIKAGITIPPNQPYSGFVLTSVSGNGWCKGHYPRNVVHGDIDQATASVRAHWLLRPNTEYSLLTSTH